MKTALYIGDHANDNIWVRAGWWATRRVQRGEFKQVTHTEAILAELPSGAVCIGSSSLRDGGVRIKNDVMLNADHWRIVDVPSWSLVRSFEWFLDHQGAKYDQWGAWATAMPGHHSDTRWFCNEAVGASVGLRSPHSFGPAQFAAICMSFGSEVTKEFFAERAALRGSA